MSTLPIDQLYRGRRVSPDAIALSGHVWTALNYRSGVYDNDLAVEIVDPALFVADADLLDRFSPTKANVVAIGGGAEGLTLEGLLAAHAGRRPVRHRLDREALQNIKFTGGSSGRQKAVMQPYRMINALIANMQAAFGFRDDEVHLAAAPITHAAGVFLLPILAQGGQNVLLPAPTPAAVVDAIEQHGVTTMFVAPTMLSALLAEPALDGRDLSSLRHVVIGGAPVPAELFRQARRQFGAAVKQVYGQTEASTMVAAMTAPDYADEAVWTSVGRPCLTNQVEIMARNGRILPAGELGEIVVSGDLVTPGYFRNEAATAATIVDGWLHTGDVGCFDARGYLYIRDRIRDVIITGGFNVFPADVESVLQEHPAVYESVVFGVADPKWGERVEAAVQCRAGQAAGAEELVAFVKQRLGPVKAPKTVHLLDDLPRSPVGKVLRREVKRQLAQAAGPVRQEMEEKAK